MLRAEEHDARQSHGAIPICKTIYKACVERKEKLPVSFVIGSHPLDFLAASRALPRRRVQRSSAALRGEPVPMVKSVTNDILVPADAEMVIEGYFDEHGYPRMKGPTARSGASTGRCISIRCSTSPRSRMRKDVIYQTVLHSGHILGRADSSNMAARHRALRSGAALRKAGIVPVAVAMGAGPASPSAASR